MKKFAFISVIVAVIVILMAFLLTGCDSKPDNSTINRNTKEWISPDGIHYWYWKITESDGVRSYVLAPRYDYEGNLVKEIHNPKESEPDWDGINTKP